MGKYFGREPRYSRQELEQQAQAAIDARVSLGRPPAEDWAPLEARLAEIDVALAARPTVPEPQPLRIHAVDMQRMPAPAAEPVPVTLPRQPVAAQAATD